MSLSPITQHLHYMQEVKCFPVAHNCGNCLIKLSGPSNFLEANQICQTEIQGLVFNKAIKVIYERKSVLYRKRHGMILSDLIEHYLEPSFPLNHKCV